MIPGAEFAPIFAGAHVLAWDYEGKALHDREPPCIAIDDGPAGGEGYVGMLYAARRVVDLRQPATRREVCRRAVLALGASESAAERAVMVVSHTSRDLVVVRPGENEVLWSSPVDVAWDEALSTGALCREVWAPKAGT